jgi:HK97 family phage major capsid protein
MKIAEIQARLEEISIEVEALADIHGDEPSQEQQDQFLALNNEAKELETKLDSAKAFEAAKAEVVARRAAALEPAKNVQPKIEEAPQEEKVEMAIPAQAKYNTSKVFASSEDAYTAGKFLMATAGDRKAADFMAAQSEGTDNKGGFTVPAPLASELINLVEEYGVARNVCRRIVMGAPTWTVPKLAGHATVFYPNEADAITASDLTFSQVSLTAQKMAGLVKMSTEINEDSLISMTDTIVRDLAWSFAKAEDEALFSGHASLYADGIEGDSDVAAHSVADVASLALTDLTAAVVAAGQERGLNHEWYMSPTLWNGQVRDILNAAGGNSQADLVGGVRPTLLGYPVNLVNAMKGAGASTSADMLCVFGDLGVSHYFGDRRSLNFRVLNELFAVNDQVGIICTQRIALKSANPEVLSKIVLA